MLLVAWCTTYENARSDFAIALAFGMMEPDALAAHRDPVQVAAAIARWASASFAGTITAHGASTLSGGFDNYVHTFTLTGDVLPEAWQGELVVRIAPSADRLPFALTEMAIQNWVVAQGFPAAPVLAVLYGDWEFDLPAQISQRAGGEQFLESVKRHPTQIPKALRRMAELHAQIHAINPIGWPDPQGRRAAPRRFYAVETAAKRGNVAIGAASRRVELGIRWCEEHPVEPAVCHGDFHPLNIVYDRATDHAVVVDWTDACLDDPHSDIARTTTLFRCAAIAGGSPIERVALRVVGPLLAFGYLRRYKKLRAVDPIRLRYWEALHLVNGWAQFDGLQDPNVASASAGATFPQWVIRSIQRRLERTLRKSGN